MINIKQENRNRRLKRIKIRRFLAYLKKQKKSHKHKLTCIYNFTYIRNGTMGISIKDYTPSTITTLTTQTTLKHLNKFKFNKHHKSNPHSINALEVYILKKNLCKNMNIESDLFDFNAYIDKTLNYRENKTELQNSYFNPVWREIKDLI